VRHHPESGGCTSIYQLSHHLSPRFAAIVHCTFTLRHVEFLSLDNLVTDNPVTAYLLLQMQLIAFSPGANSVTAYLLLKHEKYPSRRAVLQYRVLHSLEYFSSLVPGRSAVERYACTHKVRRRRSRAHSSCSTSLKGSLTTRFSKRTHTSHGETLVTSPIAPAGIFTGGSSSHLSLTRCPTAKFPFFMALEPVNIFVLHPPIVVSAISEGAKN
jgi:hypothetical protein